MDETTRDRAIGAVLAAACGDALGAPYEFGPPLGPDVEPRVEHGGTAEWNVGEWTDDTSMAIPVLEAAARGERFDQPQTLGRLVAEWADWAQDAPDVGTQTRAVLGRLDANTEEAARAAARQVHEEAGRSAGNGSLMRTTPIALAFLGDGRKREAAAAARRVSDLTHHEDDAGDACVLWTIAVRRAIRRGTLDLRRGVPLLPRARRMRWLDLIDEAEQSQASDFTTTNRWVVSAFQGAVSATIRGDGVVDALQRAVRGGGDTDTVAAITGGLAGALAGASAVPGEWTSVLHGWPGKRADWLVAQAGRAVDRTR